MRGSIIALGALAAIATGGDERWGNAVAWTHRLVSTGLLAQRGVPLANGIDRTAGEGDVVGFCPDQLGPATARYLDAPVRALTYPDGDPPQRVDWVDYRDRVDGGDPKEFAKRLLEEAGPDRTVWLVWRGGYRTHGEACETIAKSLAAARPSAQIRVEASRAFESMWLYEYPPA